MKRFHQELPRLRSRRRRAVCYFDPYIPWSQLGRYRKHRGIGCETRHCYACKGGKLLGISTTRERRLRARAAAELRELEEL